LDWGGGTPLPTWVKGRNVLSTDIQSIFTLDLEEWFCSHTEEVPEIGGFEKWPDHEERAHIVVPKVLEVLEETGVKATFFVLGWYAERKPEIIRRVKEAGHTIGCHTYAHRNLFHFDEAGLREDLRRSKAILEDITGYEVTSFRAPSFSIKRENIWALRVLAEEGFQYDSSIFPALRFDGGIPGFPPGPARIEIEGVSLYEFPISTFKLGGSTLPLFGGGYYRLAPDFLIKFGIRRLQQSGTPAMFYFHPYDFDGDQSVFPYSPLSRFRRYVRRRSLLKRVRRLLISREWALLPEHLSSLEYETEPQDFDGIKVFAAKRASAPASLPPKS